MIPTNTLVGQHIQRVVLAIASYVLPPIVRTYVAGEMVGRFFFTQYLPYHNRVIRPALQYAFTINDL